RGYRRRPPRGEGKGEPLSRVRAGAGGAASARPRRGCHGHARSERDLGRAGSAAGRRARARARVCARARFAEAGRAFVATWPRSRRGGRGGDGEGLTTGPNGRTIVV